MGKEGDKVKELLLPEGAIEIRNNLWCARFVQYFINNGSDLIDEVAFRKKLNLRKDEKFCVGMAKVICSKKIDLGILEKEAETSYQHTLYVVKRMQINFPKQIETLMTYLYTAPTDEGVALVKILLEKEEAFSKEVMEEIKSGQ